MTGADVAALAVAGNSDMPQFYRLVKRYTPLNGILLWAMLKPLFCKESLLVLCFISIFFNACFSCRERKILVAAVLSDFSRQQSTKLSTDFVDKQFCQSATIDDRGQGNCIKFQQCPRVERGSDLKMRPRFGDCRCRPASASYRGGRDSGRSGEVWRDWRRHFFPEPASDHP